MDSPSHTENNELYKVKKENIQLKMRLVKIMIILENVSKMMESSRDSIVSQLSDTTLELPTD